MIEWLISLYLKIKKVFFPKTVKINEENKKIDMHLPKNGRIAVIDDQIEQALPIIKILSKYQYPVTYYSGDPDELPEIEEGTNDIRLLFLDLNLVGNKIIPDKEIRSILIPVLERIIAPDNFPYLIVYWSRNEDEHRILLEQIFEHDLHDRKPIGYLSAEKDSFFNLEGEQIGEEFEKRIVELMESISNQLEGFHAYSAMVQWENLVHNSADKTLQNVFKPSHIYEDWNKEADSLFTKLGVSYSGKHYNDQDGRLKATSSLQTLNHLLFDNIESSVEPNVLTKSFDSHAEDVNFSPTHEIEEFNFSLLFSRSNIVSKSYPGAVLFDSSDEGSSYFKTICSDVTFAEIRKKNHSPDITKKAFEKSCKKDRGVVRDCAIGIIVICTPLCDHVQKKAKFSRAIRGILLKQEKESLLDRKSEAFYISPAFRYKDEDWIMILNFNYFISVDESYIANDKIGVEFRIRQVVLADLTSKLARHITRSGLLVLDSK